MRPLEGLLVLDFSQFLAGPSAALRLADLGARVIKIERPVKGELGRHLAVSNLFLDGDSTLFHTINRNKEGFAANLKDPADVEKVKKLISQADVMIQNFRPGVMEKLSLHYEAVREINPRLIYGVVTGYGSEGPWRNKPGQDLLAQALSGLTWLNGNADQPPMPFGLSVADLITGTHLAQGLLACLVRRGITGKGGLVEVSLIESIVDMQFELLTTHLNDGGKLPERSTINNANAYIGAPYGIYKTTDGYLALAMGSIPQLGELLGCDPLLEYSDPTTWFTQRDEIKVILVDHLARHSATHWLGILEPADIWCAEVLNWPDMIEHEAFKVLDMLQEPTRSGGISFQTTRCPVRIDGQVLKAEKGAPRVGEDNEQLMAEFGL